VVLGIHNVAIAAPQVIATLVSSVMFKLLQKPRGTAGDTSVAWVLRFGGVCALVAAWLTLRVNEEKEEEVDEPFRRRRMS
jgi:solute carrier family 45 protein 1/2/4